MREKGNSRDIFAGEGGVNKIGVDAQRETNVIGSIFVLAMAKSHRTSNDKELIFLDEEYAKI